MPDVLKSGLGVVWEKPVSVSKPIGPYGRSSERHRLGGPEVTLALATVAIAAALWFAASALPAPLILPIGSVLFLIFACGTALIAWKAPRTERGRVSYWDVSGAFTLVAICAALLSEPEHVLPLLEGAEVRR